MKVKSILLICLISIISLNDVNCEISSEMGIWFGTFVDDVSNRMFDHGGELVDRAKQAFRESMERLYESNLRPMVNEIEAMIHRNLGQIDEIIHKTIDNFKNSTIIIINTAAQQAKDLIGETIEDIKKKIIENSVKKAVELKGKILNDIVKILNNIDETIYKLSCNAQSIEKRIRDDLIKTLWFIPNPFDRCRKSVDVMFPGHYLRCKLLFWYQPNELYELRKCSLLNTLTESTPLGSILKTYKDLEELASEMRCLSVSFAATMNMIYYIKEMGEFARVISFLEEILPKETILKFLQ